MVHANESIWNSLNLNFLLLLGQILDSVKGMVECLELFSVSVHLKLSSQQLYVNVEYQYPKDFLFFLDIGTLI